MTPGDNNTAPDSSPPAPPPRLPPEVLEIQETYHRSFLAMSLAILCMCFLLPAPSSQGGVHLPFFDDPMPPLCLLKREFGIDCPGCGLTRCFLSLSHGQVASAWAYHPTGVLLFVMTVAQIPYRLMQIWRIRHNRSQITHWALRALLWLLIAAILGQWLLLTQV